MRNIRIYLASVVAILICFGIIMIYSSSGVYASQRLDDKTFFLTRHLIFLFLGTLAMFSVMAIDYRHIRKYAQPIFFVALVLLVIVLIPGLGHTSSGARRWFKLGPISFQPSEFAKLAVIIYVADFLARKQSKITEFKNGFVPIMFIMGLTCALIVKQPDLGNSVLVASVIIILMYLAGTKLKYLGSLVLALLPLLIYLIISAPYRLRRVVAFLDPWEDAHGAGFQLSQSQIALGSGGIFGVGLGQSIQKLFYLPAAHTDFIFSIIGEELGLIGTITVVVLFMTFIIQGARIVKRTTDPFGYYLAAGIVAMLGLQATVNIGVSIGALPTKGLPLPFISYGGSALIFNMIAVGLLLNISRVEDL